MLANAGALIVILGLITEFIAEADRFANNEKLKHRILKAGVLIIVLGVAVEIWESGIQSAKLAKAINLASAANERALVAESNNLVLRSNLWTLEHASPGKQPVFSASAFVRIRIESTNFVKATGAGRPNIATLSFGRRNQPDNIAALVLTTDNLSQFDKEVSFEFRWHSVIRRVIGDEQQTCDDLIGELSKSHFSSHLFPHPVKIATAEAVLTLNGSVTKTFRFSPGLQEMTDLPFTFFGLREATTSSTKN